MRVIGLDYGDKTIGVAVCDPLGIVACGLETIRRREENGLRKSLSRIAEIVREYEADTIVLGYPRNMDGSEGPRCQKTLAFRDRLLRYIKRITVVLWDERLSTAVSVRGLREGGLSRDKIDQVIDKIAAVYILQGYLDCSHGKVARAARPCSRDWSHGKVTRAARPCSRDWSHGKVTRAARPCSRDQKQTIRGVELDELEFGGLDNPGDEGEWEILTLTDDDGNEMNMAIIDVVEHKNNTYILVVDEDEADDDDAAAFIIKETGEDGDSVVYEFLEDEEELQEVLELFQSGSDDFEIIP